MTIDGVVSELGDVSRSHSSKEVCAYAGLVPKGRASAGKGQELRITKTGSPLLRGALVEAAWRVIRQSAAWRRISEKVERRAGGKKAIVAVARRLLVVMTAMLRSGSNYDPLKVGEPRPPNGPGPDQTRPERSGRGPKRRPIAAANQTSEGGGNQAVPWWA